MFISLLPIVYAIGINIYIYFIYIYIILYIYHSQNIQLTH